MFKFAILMSSLLSFSVLATTKIELAKITNDMDKEVVSFYLHTDQNDKIDSMSYVTKNALGKVVKERDWTFSEVANGGVVLDERNGHDVMKLQMGAGFTRSGGEVIISYLVNGATGTRRRLNFEVKKVAGKYRLIQADKIVTSLHVKGNYVPVIGLVGISQIQISFGK